MKLFRLICRDPEYGYDIYEGLFKTKESLLKYAIEEIEEKDYVRDNNLVSEKDRLEIIVGEEDKNHYYIRYYFSERGVDAEAYEFEPYNISYYEYEIIDTDDLI